MSRQTAKKKTARVGSIEDSTDGVGPLGLVRPVAGRILLVDDEYEDAVLLSVLLAPLQADVLVARSTEEALAILEKRDVDLVVTDLNMPGASGLDLARALLELNPVPAVIFTTGSQIILERLAAYELGALAYLQKPVDVGRLIGIVREILISRSARRSRSGVENAQATSHTR